MNGELLQKKLAGLDKLVAKLNASEVVLLVEGKRDKAALRNVGLTASIIEANGGKEQLAKRIIASQQKPVILFDFDRTGNERAAQLAELLLRFDCVADVETRKKFRLFLGMRCFEEVDSKLDRMLSEIAEKR